MAHELRRAQDILRAVSGGRPSEEGSPADGEVRPIVTQVFRDILGIDDVDPGVPFSLLGGESLLAVRILSQCRRTLGVELPLRSLGPTVTLSQFIDVLLEAKPARRSVSGGEPGPGAETFPLPAGTASLVGLHALDPESPLYSVAVKLVLTGPIDPRRLRPAVAALVRRHEALRLTFPLVDGHITARIGADPLVDYEEIDGSGPAGDGDPGHVARLIRGIIRRPLDLERSSLRVRLIRESAHRHHLVLVVHHAVCDGLSVRILLRDLTAIYRDGNDAALPRLEAGVAELARREASQLTAERRAELAERWRIRLAGAPEILNLPTEGGRPARPSLKGRRAALHVPARLRGQLQEMAASCGASVFGVLFSALAVMLRRYSGQTDLVIGVPIAGRSDPDSQEVVANLARMIPLRLTIDDGASAADLVTHAQQALLSGQEDADLPFAAIVEAARPKRMASHHPVFQVALTLLVGADELAEIPGVGIVRHDLDTGTSKFDLTWLLQEADGALEGYVEYAADLFPGALIEQMIAHLTAILEAMARSSAAKVGWLAMLSGPERRRLRDELHGGTRDSEGLDVHGMVERQAAVRPDHPALWYEGRDTSYGELNAAANRLAARLAAAGIGTEDLVGVCVERSPEQIISVLAVLKSGATYLPLDLASPPERLAYLVGDSKLDCVLVTAASLATVSATQRGLRVIDVSSAGRRGERGDGEGEAAANPGIRPAASQVAAVIYPPGLAMRPAGVQLTHAGLANLVASSGRDFELGRDTRVAQFASLAAAASIWEIFMALGWGATLCLVPADAAAGDRSVEKAIQACGATLVHLPPVLLSAVDPDRVPSVRLVLTGDDQISAELRDRWLARCRFFVAHGTTEGSVIQTWREISKREISKQEAWELPAARPIANVQLHVLDEALEPVPCGAVGEVYVSGVAVARGYLGRPGLTAGSFLPDPHATEAGKRMYRTGDLARRELSGELRFTGRADRQVRIGGNRVEPAEVEAALRDQLGVREALVTAEAGPAGLAQLVAYVEGAWSEQATLERELRDALMSRLPEHMVPARIFAVPAFPLTADRRVDVAALRVMVTMDRATLQALLSQLESAAGMISAEPGEQA